MISIDTADVEGMKESAEQLDAGKYYGLMACMITGRSWNSIVNGIYRTPRSATEVSNNFKPGLRFTKVEIMLSYFSMKNY